MDGSEWRMVAYRLEGPVVQAVIRTVRQGAVGGIEQRLDLPCSSA